MNLPNWITVVRLFVTGLVFACLELVAHSMTPNATVIWIAFGLFVFAAITDAVDGYIARRFDMVTRLGRILDPFADKFLVCGTLVYLLRFPDLETLLEAWMVVLIITRELLVTMVRGAAEAEGIPFPAERLGKWKMIAQSVAVPSLLLVLAGQEMFEPVAEVSLWLTVVLTVISGVTYMWRAKQLFKS